MRRSICYILNRAKQMRGRSNDIVGTRLYDTELATARAAIMQDCIYALERKFEVLID